MYVNVAHDPAVLRFVKMFAGTGKREKGRKREREREMADERKGNGTAKNALKNN